MKLKSKLWIMALTLPAVLASGAVLIFDLYPRSAQGTSETDLMASMGISRTISQFRAPEFALKDLEGNTVRLSDHRGKVVLVNFWTTW
jgi:hypothetical protein